MSTEHLFFNRHFFHAFRDFFFACLVHLHVVIDEKVGLIPRIHSVFIEVLNHFEVGFNLGHRVAAFFSHGECGGYVV